MNAVGLEYTSGEFHIYTFPFTECKELPNILQEIIRIACCPETTAAVEKKAHRSPFDYLYDDDDDDLQMDDVVVSQPVYYKKNNYDHDSEKNGMIG